MNMKELTNTMEALTTRIEELENKLANVKVRDRGPASTRTMTEDDARAIMLGDAKELSHKEAAAKLGLSYGQVYSARNGFTFKVVYKESRQEVQKS